jgi:hypothetical protein
MRIVVPTIHVFESEMVASEPMSKAHANSVNKAVGARAAKSFIAQRDLPCRLQVAVPDRDYDLVDGPTLRRSNVATFQDNRFLNVMLCSESRVR